MRKGRERRVRAVEVWKEVCLLCALGLHVKQSPNTQDAFWPMLGLISYARVIGIVGITHHACAIQMAAHNKCAYELCDTNLYTE